MSAFDSLVSDLKQLTQVANETSGALNRTEGMAGKGGTLGGSHGAGIGGTIPVHRDAPALSSVRDVPSKEAGSGYRKLGKQIFGRGGTFADLAEGDWRGLAKDAFQELQENPKILGRFTNTAINIGKGAFGVFQGLNAASSISAEIELTKKQQTMDEKIKAQENEIVTRGAERTAQMATQFATAALIGGPIGFAAAAGVFAFKRLTSMAGERAEESAQQYETIRLANKLRGGVSAKTINDAAMKFYKLDKYNVNYADAMIQSYGMVQKNIVEAFNMYSDGLKKIGFNDITGSLKLLSDAGNMVPWMGMPNDPVKIWSYQESARISAREWAKIGSARAGDRTGD